MFFNIGGLMFILLIGKIFMDDAVHFFHAIKTNIMAISQRKDNTDNDNSTNEDEIQLLKNDTTKEDEKPKPSTRYEDKYIDLLKNFKNSAIPHQLVNKCNKVMESTPLGNVVMWYDPDKESFHFHSDSTIPYRFLEVVARKYVVTFYCPQIYVDMEEQIELAKQKLQDQKEEKERKKREEVAAALISKETTTTKPKSNVFAKFKDYNKAQSKSSAGAPKTSQTPTTKDNENIILKENANRFTYDGRFSNFQLLVKVDRKVVDKRLNMSFADFKKMKSNNESQYQYPLQSY